MIIVKTLIEGFMMGISLIMTIGVQNAFVLRQGLIKQYLLLTALFCFLSDALMIMVGVTGLGTIITNNAVILSVSKWGGALFLFWYGFKSFRSIWTTQGIKIDSENSVVIPTLKGTIVMLTGVSFLNPHMYLDTVVLLGSVSSQYDALLRPFFAVGAMLASFVWFFTLAYGAIILRPLFEKPLSWKILDGLTATMMWTIAIMLVF